MNLQINQKPEDIFHFYRFHFWYSPDLKIYRLKYKVGFVCFFLLMPLVFFYFSYEKIPSAALILNLIIVGLLLAGLGVYLAKELAMNHIGKVAEKAVQDARNDLINTINMIFREESVLIKTQNIERSINYSAVQKAMQDKDYYFIYIDSLSALIIPKKAFSSNEERLTFEKKMGYL